MGRPGRYYNTRWCSALTGHCTPHPNPDRLGGLPRAAHGVGGVHPMGISSALLQVMATNAPCEAPCLKPSCLYLQGVPRPRETGLQQEGGSWTPETQPGPMGSWTFALTPPCSDALLPLIRPALTLSPSRVPLLPAPVQFG